jgi:hypothetical protein
LAALTQAASDGPWFQSCPPWQPDGRFVYEGSEDPHAARIVADCDPDGDIPDMDASMRDANAALIALVPELAAVALAAEAYRDARANGYAETEWVVLYDALDALRARLAVVGAPERKDEDE